MWNLQHKWRKLEAQTIKDGLCGHCMGVDKCGPYSRSNLCWRQVYLRRNCKSVLAVIKVGGSFLASTLS